MSRKQDASFESMISNRIITILKIAITSFITIYGVITGAAYFGIPLLVGSGIIGIVIIILISLIIGLSYVIFKSDKEVILNNPELLKLREENSILNEEISEIKIKNLELEEKAQLILYNKQVKISRKNSIGIVAPIIRFPTTFYLETIRGIREAGKNDTNLVLFDLNKEQIDDVRYFFKTKKFLNLVDGLITISVDIPSEDLDVLASLNYPVVNIYNTNECTPIVANINPKFNGFVNLMNHIIEEHRSKYLYLVTRPLINPMKFLKIDTFRRARRDVFYNALNKYNISIDTNDVWNLNSLSNNFRSDRSAIIETKDYSLDAGREIFSIISDKLKPDSAIICLADTVAAGFIQAAHESNYDLNGMKLRITGFDNSYIANFFDISSIDYNLPLTGELAYNRMKVAFSNLERENKLLPCIEENVFTKFIARSSCCY